ncbi:tol-pal system YbgF family protein [Acidomonas methanolica]|uniref:tetratricopeptide repeat protein n=1 Tax=Acidomonas methanolica TaxID=437 RepID=UPI00211A3479
MSCRYRSLVVAGAMAVFAAGWGSQARAQVTSREGIALQNQIQQLSQQLSQLQAAGGGNAVAAPAPAPSGSGGNSDLTAQLLDRVSQLESQVRDMRGELDQLTNEVHTQNAALSKKVDDMQFAAQTGGGASAPAAAGPVPAPAPSTDKTKTALELLKDGQGALRSGDYATAQSDAQQALKSAKTQQGRMDSQFLLAQSLAGQKRYQDSALAYYDAYKRLPRSPRAPEALLGVSASMLALGDKKSACEALNQLKADFPSPASRVKAAAASFRTRADCH